MTRRRLSSWDRILAVIRTELRRATRDRQVEHERRSAAARKAAVTRKARRPVVRYDTTNVSEEDRQTFLGGGTRMP